MYEILGYVASGLVAVSLTMSSILRLRLINLAGAVLFAIYGVFIGAVPVAAVNTFIVGVNLFYLYRMFGTREYFRILEATPGSEYLNYFLERNRSDIARHIPEFDGRVAGDDLVFFILRDVVPAGLVIARRLGGDTLDVRLDYVLPGYRDFKVGAFLYARHAAFFRGLGIRRLVMQASTRTHRRYLRRMDFSPGDGDRYVLDLDGQASGRTRA